jgi:hypothetical protein
LTAQNCTNNKLESLKEDRRSESVLTLGEKGTTTRQKFKKIEKSDSLNTLLYFFVLLYTYIFFGDDDDALFWVCGEEASSR